MNRINLGPLATLEHMATLGGSCDRTAAATSWNRSSGQHAVFSPLHYEKNYSYPLIVWLHDNGDDEGQLPKVMAGISLRNYVAVGPRGVDDCVAGGQGWFQSPRSIEASAEAVATAIDDVCARMNIAPQKIFIAGQGHGGTMAFRLAFQHPQWFAGVLSIQGGIPCGLNPLSDLNRCRHVPVFWTHRRNDLAFDERQLTQHLRLMHTAGFNMTVRQYPADLLAGQNPWADANRWMMELVTKR